VNLPLLLSSAEPWSYVLTFVVAVVTVLAAGTLLIPLLRRAEIGQRVRGDGPVSHLVKSGVPTMGGLLFFVALAVTGGFIIPPDPEVWVLMIGTLGAGLLGLADDYRKVVLKRPLGLRARTKLVGQTVMGLLLGALSLLWLGRDGQVAVPFTQQVLSLGWGYPLLMCLLYVSTTNAVNITDGLDGLAAGTSAVAFLFFALAALGALAIPVGLFAVTMLGATFGFLWYNYHPARIFMGDTGSLALGGALASLAMVTRTELLLPLLGGVFVVETLSVAIQVAYFRLSGGGRVFRMAPLHHHLELSGWSEPKVVGLMWGVSVLLAVLSLVALGRMA